MASGQIVALIAELQVEATVTPDGRWHELGKVSTGTMRRGS